MTGFVALLAIASGSPIAAVAQGLPAVPIPSDPRTPLIPSFIGAPAAERPVSAPPIPPAPHMAANGRNNIHDDAYMSDTYTIAGPEGRGTTVTTTYLVPGTECASVTFDRAGRIVSVCIGLTPSPLAGTTSNVNLLLLDPHSLERLATFSLPARPPSTTPFRDFSGGGYFYLDDQDRAVVATANNHIMVIGETATPGFQLLSDQDLTVACPAMDKLTSALPDSTGRVWFVSFNGWVGTLDMGSGTIQCLNLAPVEAGHLPAGKTTAEIENSFAMEPNKSGVYIASETAMYRFDPAPSGAPAITWQKYYDRVDVNKPGQVDTGSGTTPTLMGSDLVSITDNADPMNVVVYNRSDGTRVCKQPVFNTDAFKAPAGSGVVYASDTDNSLVGTDSSMIVENNYGYSGPTATSGGGVTFPGLSRVDLDPGGGCHTVWTSMERAPSVVPKLSLANGLLYTYTKPQDAWTPAPNPPSGADPWFFTALDFRTGQTVWSRLAGVGLGYNNNYAPVTIGPDGTAYVGVLGAGGLPGHGGDDGRRWVGFPRHRWRPRRWRRFAAGNVDRRPRGRGPGRGAPGAHGAPGRVAAPPRARVTHRRARPGSWSVRARPRPPATRPRSRRLWPRPLHLPTRGLGQLAGRHQADGGRPHPLLAGDVAQDLVQHLRQLWRLGGLRLGDDHQVLAIGAFEGGGRDAAQPNHPARLLHRQLDVLRVVVVAPQHDHVLQPPGHPQLAVQHRPQVARAQVRAIIAGQAGAEGCPGQLLVAPVALANPAAGHPDLAHLPVGADLTRGGVDHADHRVPDRLAAGCQLPHFAGRGRLQASGLERGDVEAIRAQPLPDGARRNAHRGLGQPVAPLHRLRPEATAAKRGDELPHRPRLDRLGAVDREPPRAEVKPRPVLLRCLADAEVEGEVRRARAGSAVRRYRLQPAHRPLQERERGHQDGSGVAVEPLEEPRQQAHVMEHRQPADPGILRPGEVAHGLGLEVGHQLRVADDHPPRPRSRPRGVLQIRHLGPLQAHLAAGCHLVGGEPLRRGHCRPVRLQHLRQRRLAARAEDHCGLGAAADRLEPRPGLLHPRRLGREGRHRDHSRHQAADHCDRELERVGVDQHRPVARLDPLAHPGGDPRRAVQQFAPGHLPRRVLRACHEGHPRAAVIVLSALDQDVQECPRDRRHCFCWKLSSAVIAANLTEARC